MNTTQDDGGNAFPFQPRDGTGYPCAEHSPGLSIRDWFAGMALQGLLANPSGPIQANGMSGWGWTNCDQRNVVQAAFGIADDMLVARKEAR